MFLSISFVAPVSGERLVIAGGGGVSRSEFVNGSTRRQIMAGATALIRPISQIQIQPFWSRTNTYDDTTALPGTTYYY